MTNPLIADRLVPSDSAWQESNGLDLPSRKPSKEASAYLGPSRKLSVKEAAAYLGLSVSMLNKLRLSGDGPEYIKAGRRVLYDVRDVEAWLAKLKRNHTSEPS